MTALYVALVHHPVYDRRGEVVTTAVTNLDVHDIARASRTYGVRGYFVVTPVEAQRQMVARVLSHWLEAGGAPRSPERTEALRLVRTVASLEDAVRVVEAETGAAPTRVVTSARARAGNGPPRPMDFAELRERIAAGGSWLLVFGTGWGLADAVVEHADVLLAPVRGASGDFNHLSVRSAAAVILDRLRSAPGTRS